MKQSALLSRLTITKVVCAVIIFGSYNLYGLITTHAGDRMWEVARTTQSKADIVESKLCDIESSLDDINGTFTAIDAINDKVCTVQSEVDNLDSTLDITYVGVQSIESSIDVLDAQMNSINTLLSIIRVDDFGGTWTLLDRLDKALCEKFDSALDMLSTIESDIDQLSADSLEQFTATFTKLEVLASDVIDTMIKVQDFADQLDSGLSIVDHLVDTVNMQLTTIDSKLDILDAQVEAHFMTTFTIIEGVFSSLCNVDSTVDEFDIYLESEYIDTVTSLQAIEDKACIVSSKVDVLADLFDFIKIKASIIDEPIS